MICFVFAFIPSSNRIIARFVSPFRRILLEIFALRETWQQFVLRNSCGFVVVVSWSGRGDLGGAGGEGVKGGWTVGLHVTRALELV